MARHPAVSDRTSSIFSAHVADLAPVTVADLRACDPTGSSQSTTAAAAVRRRLEKVNLTHVRALFATKKLAFSTSIIILVWAFIGLGYPLYNVCTT